MKPLVGILSLCLLAFLVACESETPLSSLDDSGGLTVAKHKPGHDRPFKGKGDGTATLTNPPASAGDLANCAPNTGGGLICEFDIEGTHRSSHMGKGSYSGDLTLDWSIYTTVQPCAKATGSVTFLAANGDALAFDVEDTSRVCETVPASSTHTVELDLAVDGGSSTGRFAGASGSVSSSGTTETIVAGSHEDSFTMEGRIAY